MADIHDSFDLQELAGKWADGTITPAEQARLETWYAGFSEEEITLVDSRHAGTEALKQAMLAKIHSLMEEDRPVRVLWAWRRLVAAAAVLLFLSAGGYYLLQRQTVPQLAQHTGAGLKPGESRATLTLADGRKIVLRKQMNGQLAQQGNTRVQVNHGQSLTYMAGVAGTAAAETAMNTLTTVRGEQSPYPLVLADGTKVWLNAASSITFPVAFRGRERKVTITGEVYFEVVHNAARPFKVEAKGQTIEDLGTAFNINAYDDEPDMKTTLISGSVKINNLTTLKPGQVAIQKGTGIRVKNVDTEGATAWKNGYFLFDKEDLPGIMRKISRWYDVDIEYPQGQNISAGFLGSITRYGDVSQVLSMLETTGHVKFKIDGKKIIVTKR